MPSFFNHLFKQNIKLILMASLTIMLLLFTSGCSVLDELEDILTSNDYPINTQQADMSQLPDDNIEKALTSFEDVAHYIRMHGALPPNFITKKEAQSLGWIPAKGNLPDVAPGKSIGGDRFGNREGLLPNDKGRIWYEADINYVSGTRGSDRIVYSNDGLIYMTTDHYKSFTNITDEGSLNK